MFNAGDEMEIDLLKLKNNLVEGIDIDLIYSFDKQIENTEILELKDVIIRGYLTKDSLAEIYLLVDVIGTMVLPCAITLEPVNYPFDIHIEGNVNELLKEMDENNKKVENTLDILPIIWENVLMEIPLRVVSENAVSVNLAGDGWRLVTEEETTNEHNPELAKLKDLL